MTREEIKTLGFEELENRATEIAAETAEADAETIEKLNDELEAIEERKLELNKEVEERKKAVEDVLEGKGKEIEPIIEERKTMNNKEVRNTKEYIEAYANYIKTGDDTECRAILTENVEGGILPVPEIAENTVRQAWENDEVFSRVTKTFVKGNLRIGFEVSATDAGIHVEGSGKSVEEEQIVLGIVRMVPQTIKKWITFSTEAAAMGAEDFLRYIYDELTYKIIQKAADEVVKAIQDAPAESTEEAVGVAKIEGEVTPQNILNAIAALGDNARNNVFLANGTTIAAVRAAALEANFAFDPFFGLTVIKKDGVEGAIIGDLGGVQANLPEGDGVKFVYDEFSLAEEDMIKLVRRLYAAIAVTGPKMLAVIGSSESE